MHTARGCRDMLPINPSERPGAKFNGGSIGILQNRRPTQDRELAGRRARRGYQEWGNKSPNIVVTMAKWRPQNHPEAAIFLISPWQGNRRGDIHLLSVQCLQLAIDYYPTTADFDEAGALELAHHLGDGLPGGKDHLGEVLVREAYHDERARAVRLPEAAAQVREQRCQARRHFPVQETLERLLGLPKALGELGEQLQSELWAALYHLVEDSFPHHGHPDAGILKVLEHKMPRIYGGQGSRDVTFKQCPARLSSRDGEYRLGH
jgi:hypothetical protein